MSTDPSATAAAAATTAPTTSSSSAASQLPLSVASTTVAETTTGAMEDEWVMVAKPEADETMEVVTTSTTRTDTAHVGDNDAITITTSTSTSATATSNEKREGSDLATEEPAAKRQHTGMDAKSSSDSTITITTNAVASSAVATTPATKDVITKTEQPKKEKAKDATTATAKAVAKSDKTETKSIGTAKDDATKENQNTANTATTKPQSTDTAAVTKETKTKEDVSETKEEKTEEILDLCEQLGLDDGTRLQVEWQVMVEDEEAADDAAEKSVTKWWGCTLLPWEGKSDDGVKIRTLEYDPDVANGFTEKSLEEVIFLSHDLIISPGNEAEFKYRPEEVMTFASEEETREAINNILQSVMTKHASTFQKLARDQQNKLAYTIAQKKEQLIEAIMSHDKSPVIGPDDMQEMLKGIMSRK